MNGSVKRVFTSAVMLGLATLAYAQSPAGDQLTVPFSDPSRPGTVEVSLITGSISVRGYNGKEVIVETKEAHAEDQEHRRRRVSPPEAAGLKKIQNPASAIKIEEEGNVIKIETGPPFHWGDIAIQVPSRTGLKLKTINGDINVEQTQGEIEVNAINGAATLTQVSGSVVAHALHGKVKVGLVGVGPDKPMSFSSLNGDIDVTLPSDIKANVSMKSDYGGIYSDFDIKIDASASRRLAEESRSEDGKYRINMDRTTRGTINGGGPELQFKTFRGNIYIRKSSSR